jgi:hypothetical protein
MPKTPALQDQRYCVAFCDFAALWHRASKVGCTIKVDRMQELIDVANAN